MTIVELKDLIARGEFHHATYRNINTLWEGLYVYKCDDTPAGFRGFSLAGCFRKGDSELQAAEDLLRPTGVSVGSYGNG